jgi:hypothetical protein
MGDAGKGTAKAFLERIADLEEDAQRSFMHRSDAQVSVLKMTYFILKSI